MRINKKNKGVISLCHMSAPEAKLSYELEIKNRSKNQQLYQLFLDWALSTHVDGIIVGATYPKIISYCKNSVRGKLSLFSPGVGTQGGSPSKTKKLTFIYQQEVEKFWRVSLLRRDETIFKLKVKVRYS